MIAKNFFVAASLTVSAFGACAAIYDISATSLSHAFTNTGPPTFTTQANGFRRASR